VTGYIIERDVPQLGTTNYYTNTVTSCTHVDNPFPVAETNLLQNIPIYQLTALYPGGRSLTAQVGLYALSPAYLWNGAVSGTAAFIRGPGGNPYLAWSGVTTTVPAVKLVRRTCMGTYCGDGDSRTWTILTSSFTNGVCPIAVEIFSSGSGNYWSLELTNANGLAEVVGVGNNISTVPFFDGRKQLQENLTYEFRGATEEHPLRLTWQDLSVPSPLDWWETFYYPTNYAYSGLYDTGTPTGNAPALAREFWPFKLNAKAGSAWRRAWRSTST
jgi:hypothetical protein